MVAMILRPIKPIKRHKSTNTPPPSSSPYQPGREDDDSGLQVSGLQQQRRQVGVLVEEQHLLGLEDHGDRLHGGTVRNMAEQEHHRTDHRARVVKTLKPPALFLPPSLPQNPPPPPWPEVRPCALSPTLPLEEGAGPKNMRQKRVCLPNWKKTQSRSSKEGKGAKSCAWCGGTCKLRHFQDSNQPTNQGRACYRALMQPQN